jgi:hypothetical protein
LDSASLIPKRAGAQVNAKPSKKATRPDHAQTLFVRTPDAIAAGRYVVASAIGEL